MMSLSSIPRWIARLSVPLACSSCFAIADLERFEPTAEAINIPFRSLKMSLLQMTPHPQNLMEVYIISNSTNVIQMHGIMDPLGDNDLTLTIPYAVPTQGGDYRFDFYGDLNNSGGYDGIGSVLTNDHAWRFGPLTQTNPQQNIDASKSTIAFTFVHNTIFTDINLLPGTTTTQVPHGPAWSKDQPDAGTIKLSFTGMDTYLKGDGKRRSLLARVASASSANTVAFYRIPNIKAQNFDLKIPNMVEQGVSYNVQVYIDANGDGNYQKPAEGADEGWQVNQQSTVGGLNVALSPATVGNRFVDIGGI